MLTSNSSRMVWKITKAGSKDQLKDQPREPGAKKQEVGVVRSSKDGLRLLPKNRSCGLTWVPCSPPPALSQRNSSSNSVQSLRRVRLFVAPWTAARQASLPTTNAQIHPNPCPLSRCCHPTISASALIFPGIRVFSSESALHIRWPKYWSFSFNISPSSEHPGLISFRMDWLDLLAVQGTLNTLLQHHSSQASILRHSAFFIVQLSHAYMTTGKTIALTGRTFVAKVMSLLFSMLSRLVITFLPRSKRLLISWLQSPSTVILEPQKIKSGTVSTVSPSICHEVMGPDAMILFF